MKNALQAISGILLGALAALVTSGIVMGSFFLALAEGELGKVVASQATPTIYSRPTLLARVATLVETQPLTFPSTSTQTAAATAPPSPTAEATSEDQQGEEPSPPKETRPECNPPNSWVLYIVQRGDTLYGISQRAHISVDELRTENCLKSHNIIYVGQKLYVPRSIAGPPTVPPRPTETKPPPPTKTPPPPETPPDLPVPKETDPPHGDP